MMVNILEVDRRKLRAEMRYARVTGLYTIIGTSVWDASKVVIAFYKAV